MEEISYHRGNNRRSTDSFERAVCHHIRQRVSGSGDLFSAFLIAATDFVATDFVHRSEKNYLGGVRQMPRLFAY